MCSRYWLFRDTMGGCSSSSRNGTVRMLLQGNGREVLVQVRSWRCRLLVRADWVVFPRALRSMIVGGAAL